MLLTKANYSYPNLTVIWPNILDLMKLPENLKVKYQLLVAKNSLFGSSAIRCGSQQVKDEKNGVFSDINTWSIDISIDEIEPYRVPGSENLLSYMVKLTEKDYYNIYIAAKVYEEKVSKSEPIYNFFYDTYMVKDFDGSENDTALKILISNNFFFIYIIA